MKQNKNIYQSCFLFVYELNFCKKKKIRLKTKLFEMDDLVPVTF